MSLYLDASVVLALFVKDGHHARAMRLVEVESARLLISDFARAEFASGVSRWVRIGDLDERVARATLATFDAWTATHANGVTILSADVLAAAAYIRRLDLPLRTPDAIHIAIAQRQGARLATFDAKLADCARTLGVDVVTG